MTSPPSVCRYIYVCGRVYLHVITDYLVRFSITNAINLFIILFSFFSGHILIDWNIIMNDKNDFYEVFLKVFRITISIGLEC